MKGIADNFSELINEENNFAYQSQTEADNPNGFIVFGITVCSPFFR